MFGSRTEPGDPWSRRALLRTLAGVLVAALLAVFGVAYAVYAAVRGPLEEPAAKGGPPPTSLPSGTQRRDAIAAAPMLTVPPSAARGGTPASDPGPTITVPASTELGAAEVPTGFPRTPEGALGQLAAIESTVLQGMSVQRATGVHQAWAQPGTPPAGQWALVRSIQAFHTSRAGSAAAPLVSATPVAGQVKGVDGPDWVLACVLMDVRAQVASTARIAYGHCERMQWLQGRWVIGAGPAPARAPSTWPETALAHEAGWATWSSSGPTDGEG